MEAQQFIGNTRCVIDFTKLERIGMGTYGIVYKARDKQDGMLHALKQIKIQSTDTDGFPITSLREIAILKQITHPNIVKLEDVVVGYKQESIFLGFEYCRIDLANLVDQMVNKKLNYFSLAEIKCLMLQIASAVSHLHQNNIIHRDLKLSNLLLTDQGILKLADFGLARQIAVNSQSQMLTPKLVTLWYRAPEILLRCQKYGPPCDVWALGCILGELLNKGQPVMPGKNEVDQYVQICELIGKPQDQQQWPEFFDLPNVNHLKKMCSNKTNFITQCFEHHPPECADLLRQLLCWNPGQRLTLNEILLHPFFTNKPYPLAPHNMDCLKFLQKVQQ